MSAPRGLVLAGTHSGVGKSTVTAGLLRAFRNAGRTVAPFKAGPDYLDPKLHAAAAGRASWNLDGWFMDDAALAEALGRGAAGADLALIEGVMGLFDGAEATTFRGSTAELAVRLGLPAVLLVDGSAVGGSLAATVLGHQRLWPELHLAGVLLNRVGSEGHAALLRRAVEHHTGVPVLGSIPPQASWELPERHLGIWSPDELPTLEPGLEALARTLAATVDLPALEALAAPLPPAPAPAPPASGPRIRVGLARDEAFTFTYADTLDRLERLGVEWVPFSPLRDARLPEGLAGLYLPGGYPELHARSLSANAELRAGLKAALEAGLPCYAECGGLMYLAEALVTREGQAYPMVGVLPGRTVMTASLQRFGYKLLRTLRSTLLAPAGSVARGHEFHGSVWEGPTDAFAYEASPVHGPGHLEGFARGDLLATYCHLHFASAPAWAERWVARMRARAAKG